MHRLGPDVLAHTHPEAMAMANEMLFARGKEPTKATLRDVRV